MNRLMDRKRIFTIAAAGCVLSIILIFIYLSYANFFWADWTFDDQRIFKHLPEIENVRSGLEFVFNSHEVSQLGRPVALASFLLNISDWPGNPAGFRRINSLLHILNGLLLTLILIKVSSECNKCRDSTIFSFSLTVSAIWMLHPLMASTSFHAVQRMTLLAGLFILLGFLAYVHGRSLLLTRPKQAIGILSLSLIIPGILGVLSKETAILLPLLLAITEYAVLNRERPVHFLLFIWWRRLFLGIPIIFIACYSLYYLFEIAPFAYFHRPYSLSERLFSQAIILWEYVRQIFFPNISVMGPYQDDAARIHGLDLLSGAALISWVAIIVAAYVLRRKLPLLFFAVFFFLGGHVLESTFFSLELFFEHRNYIPSIGPIVGLTALAWSAPKIWPKLLLVTYTLLLAGLLWSLTTLWGHPILGPIAWFEQHPTSVRATQVATTMFWRIGNIEKAKETILKGFNEVPNNSVLATNVLTYQCFYLPSDYVRQRTDALIQAAPSFDYGRTVSAGLYATLNLLESGDCDGLSPAEAIRFTEGILANPRFTRRDQRKALYLLLSNFAMIENNFRLFAYSQAMAFLSRPWVGGGSGIFYRLHASGSRYFGDYFAILNF